MNGRLTKRQCVVAAILAIAAVLFVAAGASIVDEAWKAASQ